MTKAQDPREQLAALAERLRKVGQALAESSAEVLIADQIDYIVRRLKGHAQKPYASLHQQTIVRHDLAAAAYWLYYLEQTNVFSARRLAPLRQEIHDLLATMLASLYSPVNNAEELTTAPLLTYAMPTLPPPEPEPPPDLEPLLEPEPLPELAPLPRQTTPDQSNPLLTKIQLDKQIYTWNGTSWYDERFLKPPTVIIRQLNDMLAAIKAGEDWAITDLHELAKRARAARETMQHERAESLARRILLLQPDSHIGAAILCAALRARHSPLEALAQTERFVPTSNTALLTSRAAAYCDLGMWKEAKQEVGKSLAIETSQEALLVVQRIKAAKPGLYRNNRRG